MMRQPTWVELNKHALVTLIDRVFTVLGEKLVKRKLAQAVPVAGVLINAGLSAQMADSAYRSARYAYRLRFLSEKYGIDPGGWARMTLPLQATPPGRPLMRSQRSIPPTLPHPVR